ncbi:thiopeptide-type bacteriocin biosynthesis protein [Microbispora sp. NBRC 16548]|uniref:thiopeptide-type bacteriocin biosynthesis protein n=1 Tax=Microbispora sp. NBRC 16548 TaxID=3030994 RepID=UPI0024A4D7DF|nr:thiopeptide-type bacteriocin biosynthesis protein [Microbispora sp. NBRC 16548]GLX06646.1 hypothetical protein Misp03_35730 [Microbispora sp. NBRC 16548]
MDWYQCNVQFTHPAAATVTAAAELLPALTAAQDSGVLHCWWFIREKEQWRLRYAAAGGEASVVDDLLDTLAADGRIVSWAPDIYEPETLKFGGEQGIAVAHELFHQDSRYLLAQPDRQLFGLRETSVLLYSVLIRAAGLGWDEQREVWVKVSEHRPSDPAHPLWPPEWEPGLRGAMRRLLASDARVCPSIPVGWAAAFETAGRSLADLAQRRQLQGDLREVLAHHWLFHANRAGLPVGDQAATSALAVSTLCSPTADGVFPGESHTPMPGPPIKLTDDAPTPSEELRAAPTDRLLQLGTSRRSARSLVRTRLRPWSRARR